MKLLAGVVVTAGGSFVGPEIGEFAVGALVGSVFGPIIAPPVVLVVGLSVGIASMGQSE